MKKLIAVLLLVSIVTFSYRCGSGGEKKEDEKTQQKNEEGDITKSLDYQVGLELVAKSDCFTCHKIEEQFTGPSYRDVANKYAGMSDTIITHLAGKIIHGGNGVWGQVFMTPHATLSQADAEAMVKYILLLKK